MTPELAHERLQSGLRKWRVQLALRHALFALAASLLLVTAMRLLWPLSAVVHLAALLISFALILSMLLIRARKRFADVEAFAHHCNRVFPELEESCELVLKPEDALSVLERLQRRRALQAVDKIPAQQLYPRSNLTTGGLSAAGATLLAIVILIWPPAPIFESTAGNSIANATPINENTSHSPETLPAVGKIVVRISPPGYTGKSARVLAQLDLQAEEGAQVSWEIAFNKKLSTVQLIFSEGDTLSLAPVSEFRYSAKRVLTQNGFYHLAFGESGANTQKTDYHKIEIIKDQPPQITLAQPEQRTELAPEATRRLAVQAAITDDYSIRSHRIVATLAKGTGEAVKFREQILAFDQVQMKSSRQHDLATVLDLHQLGMAPGDELYFFVEAWDNRAPQAQRSRSETFFVILQDTAQVTLASSAGLLINPLPEYFRSQRQIIIDTEKLMQDKTQVSTADFNRRSNGIGIDQKLLRLRYGQFLGEEAESAAFSQETMPHSSEAHEESGHGERAPSQAKESAANIVEQFAHVHDSEENATLFAVSIKAQLKAALAEMWQAELHLRTHRPEQALPFEYRALALLKDVQQRERAYVQRVGFEPAPLKPEEKRLTGDLSKIQNLKSTKEIIRKDPFAALRRARALLQQIKKSPQPLEASATNILEEAGQELAQHALQKPGRYLKALQALRTLINSLSAGEVCRECPAPIEQAIWSILPPEPPAPSPVSTAHTSLGQRYLQKLEAQP